MKKIISVILSFLIFSPIFSAFSYAEEVKPAMQWHCLEAIRCDKPEANCLVGPGVVLSHRAKLTTKSDDLPARNKNTYVFSCFTTEQGNICTSGNSLVDKNVIGYDGIAKLQQSTSTGGYQFQGLFRSDGKTPVKADEIKSNSRGKLTVNGEMVEPLEWQDYTPRGTGRKWLALNLIDPIELEMGRGGQQQGTFTFEGALSKCVEIHWDPYGIVFDSQSLEPIPGVAISLLKKRDNGQFTLVKGADVVSIINPLYTQEDGAFSFFVPDGTYKLEASASNFNFPNNPLKLNSNYSKIYSNIYRGEEIVQKGEIEHRDLPLDSKNSPYIAPVKLMSYFPLLDKGSNTLILQGRVSHPLTTINVYAKKATGENTFIRSKILLTGSADNQGRFDLKVDLNNLDPDEFFGDLELIKSSLMGSLPRSRKNSLSEFLSLGSVLAAPSSSTYFSIEPIFNHIEGYAYDNQGGVLPNTIVGVYLNFSNKPLYETKTDEKGFFTIPSEYLPPLAYTIRYTTPTGISRVVVPSKFIADNRQYFTNQKSNLYRFKDRQGRIFEPQKTLVVKPTTIQTSKAGGFFGQQPSAKTTGASTSQATGVTQANILIIVAILLILIAIIATVGALYLYKKNQQKLS